MFGAVAKRSGDDLFGGEGLPWRNVTCSCKCLWCDETHTAGILC